MAHRVGDQSRSPSIREIVPRTREKLRPLAIALGVSIGVACGGQRAQVAPRMPVASGIPVTSGTPGKLVPEIIPEPQPPPAPCVDTVDFVSAADSAGIYPPVAIEFFLPPLPAPADVRGFHLIAEFEVTPCRATLIGMSRSVNARYNERLQSALLKLRFRPGTTASGKPVRAKARIGYQF